MDLECDELTASELLCVILKIPTTNEWCHNALIRRVQHMFYGALDAVATIYWNLTW